MVVPPEDPVVDAQTLGKRIDQDWGLLRELTEVFEEDYPRIVESLGVAVAASDAVSTRTHAHTLKGIAANLSAQRAQHVALRLEEIGRSGVFTPEAPLVFRELCRELEAACFELRRIVREMCGP